MENEGKLRKKVQKQRIKYGNWNVLRITFFASSFYYIRELPPGLHYLPELSIYL